MTFSSRLFAALAVSLAAPAIAADTVSIELRFAGIETPSGAILASIFDSEAGWAAGKPVRSVMIPVSGTEATQLLEGLAPGTYGIKSFHDIDGDGNMGTNPFGLPLEPFAFSNNAAPNMGPPAWGAAKFEATGPTVVQTISIK